MKKTIRFLMVILVIVFLVGCENDMSTTNCLNSAKNTVLTTETSDYQIGDIGPAGGYIFYDDEADSVDDIAGYRYLEVSKDDYTSTVIWGTHNHEIDGASGTAIGTGYQNTLDIIAGDSETDKAADVCDNYSVTVNGVLYDDWFLPSKEELHTMMVNLAEKGLWSYNGKNYWSSTVYNSYNAWAVWDPSYWSKWWGEPPENYELSKTYKRYYLNVRPIRAFN